MENVARYAMVLYRIGNFPESWKQLFVARKLDPKHFGVSRGIDALMDAFTKMGDLQRRRSERDRVGDSR